MTFVLDQTQNKRQKRCLLEPSKSLSFLTYVQTERNTIMKSHRERLAKTQELSTTEGEYGKFKGDVQQRVALKRRIMDLRRKLHECEASPTPEAFDRAVVPFLDMYHTTERKDVSDDQLINMYKQEFFASTSVPQLHAVETDHCACGREYLYCSEDARLYCPQCGSTHVFMDATSSTIAYGDEIEYTSFSYKRINHLNEWLNHFQAKETNPVPNDVLQKIMGHFFENRCIKPDTITYAHVKKAQKSLGLRKYYDQTMQIWCRLTGRKPLRLDPVCEEKIRLMFIQIQKPFDKYCPSTRKNFLSYPYCMYKFCQLLGHYDILPYFSLLKGKDKLQVQEEIFEKICRELGWAFVPIPNN